MSAPALCQKCRLCGQPKMPQNSVVNGPDVLLVGGYPTASEVRCGAFTGRYSSIARQVVLEIQKNRRPTDQLKIDYAYSCQCCPKYNAELNKFDINADDVRHCSIILRERIDRTKPKVLVVMGADAAKSVGLKANVREMRGGIYNFRCGDDQNIPVVVTYHVAEVSKAPGLLHTFELDIKKAFSLARDEVVIKSLDISTPITFSDIMVKLGLVETYLAKKYVDTGKPVALAVDTETTSLTPHVQSDRVIAVSLSWAEGEGMAYPFEHAKVPFTPEEFAAIKEKTERILSMDAAALVMANGKFDIQWLKYRYGLNIGELKHDVMLAEHVLDEDKKGEYGLKDITRDRFPSMGKYEEELHEHLNSVWEAKDQKIEAIKEAHKQATKQAIITWWVGLSQDERRLWIAKLLDSGRGIKISDMEDLHNIKQRKLHGELVIPKKYVTAVEKLVNSLPIEELPSEVKLPEPEIPECLTVRSFEDADVAILLKYAAIDAITTRMICAAQLSDFVRDAARVKSTEAAIGRRIPAPTCRAAMARITTPLCQCLAHMEYNGVALDREKARQYQSIITEKLDEARDAMFMEVGRKFNPSSSSPDLGKILYSDLKLPVKKYTATGAPSTDADVLKELSDECNLPFLDKLLVYRKLDKCLHTYIENWLSMSELDGKIHAKFNQIGTATYRLSSSNPNLQNIPFYLKEAELNLKALFIPDSDNYDLYDLDISNAEMRVLAAYSRDDSLTGAFNNGIDLHCLTAAGISDYTYEDIKAHKEDKNTDQYRKRQLAKKVNELAFYKLR